MNSNSSHNSPPPAFVPAFYASSYGDDSDDEQLEFSAEHMFSGDNAAAPAMTVAAAPAVADADDDALFEPRTTYRDTHHVFASGPCDLVFHSESFVESSFLNQTGKTPMFVLEPTVSKTTKPQQPLDLPVISASPLSPSSYVTSIDVPSKDANCSFFRVNPVMPSRATPTAILASLQAALKHFECEFDVVDSWTIRATLLCVAEELAMTISLARVDSTTIDVDFLLRSGDEGAFLAVTEHIRTLCADVDADAMPFWHETLDAHYDATQAITGRRHAISASDALALVQQLAQRDVHVDTARDVARTIKNRCRHRGNRALFVQNDAPAFVEAIKWMLSDGDDVMRYGVFVLAQFASDSNADTISLCQTPYDKSALAVLLEDVKRRHEGAPCGKFTRAMVEQVQQSALFC